jgi:hypothetical protein
MSDRHHRRRRIEPTLWAEHDTQMCRAFLRALGRWVIAHHADPDATVTLPTGTVGVVELGQVLHALDGGPLRANEQSRVPPNARRSPRT